jgi:hypothetical protein
VKYFVERIFTEQIRHRREVDATELPELVAAYLQYLTPGNGTLVIGRTE